MTPHRLELDVVSRRLRLMDIREVSAYLLSFGR